jgi:Fanconi anemia group J protein
MDQPKKPRKVFNGKSLPKKKRDNALTRAVVSRNDPIPKPDEVRRVFHDCFFQGVHVKFPFKPYPSQSRMILSCIKALLKKENALLESPTGSGKTLVLLCSVLAWREFEKQRQAKAWQEQMQLEVKEDAEERRQVNEQTIPFDSDSEDAMTELPAAPFDANDSDDDFMPVAREVQPHVDPQDAKRRAAKEKKKLKEAYKAEDLKRKRLELLDERASKRRHAKGPKIDLPKIYFASRTTKQVSQLISELKRNSPYKPKMAVLASRAHMCINSKVTDKNLTESINEKCKNLMETHDCSYFTKMEKLLTHRTLYSKEEKDRSIWDIEDLKALGKKTKGCPYFASRQIGTSLVFKLTFLSK